MDTNLQSLGVGGILLVLVLRMVFDFLKEMKKAKKPEEEACIFSQKDRNVLYDLHRWHDRMDEDGVPVWYVRSSLEGNVKQLTVAIEQLARSGDAQLHAFEQLCQEVRANGRARTEDAS